ncbi:hypothetical protein [Vibrio harveyi]|uniref:hypothetical protein n=1 Tax=Vibrio harveyi TaxID=669 RepID=UPI003CF1B3CC
MNQTSQAILDNRLSDCLATLTAIDSSWSGSELSGFMDFKSSTIQSDVEISLTISVRNTTHEASFSVDIEQDGVIKSAYGELNRITGFTIDKTSTSEDAERIFCERVLTNEALSSSAKALFIKLDEIAAQLNP